MIASSYLSEAAISIMSSEIRIGFAGTGFGKIQPKYTGISTNTYLYRYSFCSRHPHSESDPRLIFESDTREIQKRDQTTDQADSPECFSNEFQKSFACFFRLYRYVKRLAYFYDSYAYIRRLYPKYFEAGRLGTVNLT